MVLAVLQTCGSWVVERVIAVAETGGLEGRAVEVRGHGLDERGAVVEIDVHGGVRPRGVPGPAGKGGTVPLIEKSAVGLTERGASGEEEECGQKTFHGTCTPNRLMSKFLTCLLN